MAYLGESCLAYHCGSSATPSVGVFLSRFGGDVAYYADAKTETEDGDIKMDVSKSKYEQEGDKQVEDLGDKQEDMKIKEDNEDLTESSATAAGEDKGAKGYQPSSSSSTQASQFGTPASFGPSTLESYERNHKKLGEFEGFLHNLLGEAFHDVYKEMCQFFQDCL
ncbi:hypothetical protein GY45DRAFT_1376444 [Cubamyces sp. BRFM 1775]|nr:hypothetical protein GY45DRAFT_1376444 [Cubamyces sp. BRFM 1775]